jgi:hypothetical protein
MTIMGRRTFNIVNLLIEDSMFRTGIDITVYAEAGCLSPEFIMGFLGQCVLKVQRVTLTDPRETHPGMSQHTLFNQHLGDF